MKLGLKSGRTDHVQNAMNATLQIQKNCGKRKEELNIGIGIHTGECFMGEVGTSYKDFTAIGPVVNLASRLEGAAAAGEILITDDVFNNVKNKFPHVQSRTLT